MDKESNHEEHLELHTRLKEEIRDYEVVRILEQILKQQKFMNWILFLIYIMVWIFVFIS